MEVKDYRVVLKQKQSNVLILTTARALYGAAYDGSQLVSEIAISKSEKKFWFVKAYKLGLLYAEV